MIRDSQTPQDTRTQVRGSTLLLVGRLLALAMNLGVQILLVRHLSKVEYGAFAFAISVVAVGANLSLLGLNKSFSRFGSIYHEQRDFARMAGTAILVLSTVLGLGFAFALVTVASRGYLSGVVTDSDLSVTLLLTLIALVPIDSLDAVFQSWFSIFAEVRSVFFRRHIMGPGLKLAAVVLVIWLGADVQALAACYLGAGLLGLLFYAALLFRILRRDDLARHFRRGQWTIPVRDLFTYSLPLFSSQFCFLFRGALVVLMLEMLRGSESVAEFRAVLPFARLNLVVHESFLFLFLPLASRMFARNESDQLNELYCKSTIWVAVLTFPVFLATTVTAGPLTTFMLGERYAGSASILAVLAGAFFVDAILGYAASTLRVYARVRQIVTVDVVALVVAIGLNLWLIPHYGAMGAAVATFIGVVGQNIGYLIFMRRSTDVGRLPNRLAAACLPFVVGGGALALAQSVFTPPLLVSLALVATSGLVVFFWNLNTLAAAAMFPELARLPVIGRLFRTDVHQSVVEESISTVSTTSRRQQIACLLQERATDYFPELDDGFEVRFCGVVRRSFSTLYHVDIVNGQLRFAVTLKETARPHDVDQGSASEVPRRILDRFRPTPDPRGHEQAALQAIDRHYSDLADSRFETVGVLDEWFDGWAFLMERVPHPSMSRLLPQAMWGSMRSRDLGPACRNAGAWLREFHDLAPPAHTNSSIDPAAEFMDEVTCLQNLLEERGETRGPFQDMLRALPTMASEVLSSDLPTGLAHDDFAPRNVLVAPNNAVIVIDTLADRIAPIYEDVAHFLVHLKGHKLQLIGRGLPVSTRTHARLEHEFLCGYFGDDQIPIRAIRLFEIKALIARWATFGPHETSSRRPKAFKRDVWQRWVRACFVRMLRRLREEVDDSSSPIGVGDRRLEMLSFVNRLERRSTTYFEDLKSESPVIFPEPIRENRFSTVFSARVGTNGISHRVIAKVPRNSNRGLVDCNIIDRPRLTPLLTAREEAEHEYAALMHIHRHLTARGVGRLRSVRPLDFCPQNGAVILEGIEVPTLHDRIQQAGVLSDALLLELFADAGRWLRSLHGLPLPERCQIRDATRQEFEENVVRYTTYLAAHGVDRRFLRTVEESLVSLGEQALPHRMPLGLCHGDFAPHNLFAYQDGTVAAFDTLCHWQAPIYEDLAHFLFVVNWDAGALKSRELKEHERALLHSYFENEPVPFGAVQAFFVLIVLDKWASAIQGVHRAGPLKKPAKRMFLPRRQRRFRQFVEQALAEIRASVENTSSDRAADLSISRSV